MFYLASGDLPDSWYEVLLLPVFFSAVGAVIYVSGRNAEIRDAAKPWKWWAALPFGLALLAGWRPFMSIRDSFYQAAIEPNGKKMLYAHYGSFLLPLIVMGGIAAWQYMDTRRRAAEE
jgi:hypothetical protein